MQKLELVGLGPSHGDPPSWAGLPAQDKSTHTQEDSLLQQVIISGLSVSLGLQGSALLQNGVISGLA